MRQKNPASTMFAVIMVVALLFFTSPVQAQSQEEEAVYTAGSLLLSILHVPFKLATCVGTQALVAVGYVTTYGVEGNYEGGTNGRELGGYAAGACKGQWIIRAEDVKRDYQ
ncbi:MAG TPA: hypothetical protein VNL14_23210 [Candidatus Acidoferrales bacterium]|nr:hypothetical protein [Candidatus Acidoferrales bacterium]